MLNFLICLDQILRKYGAPKPNKNKYSKAGKEQHQGKVMSTKRPISKPPTKEKSVLNSVRYAVLQMATAPCGETLVKRAASRTALSEKKAVLKSKSPEKSRSDEKDLEKSPPKKAEGWWHTSGIGPTAIRRIDAREGGGKSQLVGRGVSFNTLWTMSPPSHL